MVRGAAPTLPKGPARVGPWHSGCSNDCCQDGPCRGAAEEMPLPLPRNHSSSLPPPTQQRKTKTKKPAAPMWAPSSAGDLLPPDAAYPERPGPPKHLDRGMLRRLRQASDSAELMRLFAQADPQLVQYFRDGGTVGSDSDPESPGRADPSMLDAQVGSGMDTTLDGI